MKKRYKVILWAVLSAIASIVALCFLLWAGFHARYWKKMRSSPRPGYLTTSEISDIEKAFAVTFPVSSRRIQVYYNGDGGLYCHVEFDESDLENFKKERLWFSGAKGGKIVARNAVAPLRSVIGFFGGEPVEIEWWRVSPEQVLLASSITTPKDPGGHIDIVLQGSKAGKVSAYMARLATRNSLPSGVLNVFPPNQIEWDLRESEEYPKRDSME